ncbi:MAG: YbjQ family protein [archaeon]|nr:YbjQ family protein [archaeon]
MLMVNTDFVQGKTITQTLGVVKGNTIRAKWFGKDIMAGLRQIVGGELKEYTEMLTEARQESTQRMVEEAESLKADAIINVRFTTCQVMASAAEIMVYGTAVKLK